MFCLRLKKKKKKCDLILFARGKLMRQKSCPFFIFDKGEQTFGFIVQSGAPLKVSVLCYYVLLCLR